MNAEADIRSRIEAANGQFMSGFTLGDAAVLASRYKVQARPLPAHSDCVKGSEAMRACLAGRP